MTEFSHSDPPPVPRPYPVTLIGWLFIVVGILSLGYHASEIKLGKAFDPELLWFVFVPILAIGGGIFALRARNWARWLLITWIGYHVIVSFWHPLPQLIFHCIFFLIVVAALMNRRARLYFST